MSLVDIDRELTRNSYYAATASRGAAHAPLHGSIEADVAIVGGGLAGLSAAIELADRGHQVVLLEAAEIGGGASGRNGGQAIHGLASDQSTIEEQLGLDTARQIWRMSIEALDLIQERCARFGIDCEYQAGFLGLSTKPRKTEELRAWADRMAEVYDYPL